MSIVSVTEKRSGGRASLDATETRVSRVFQVQFSDADPANLVDVLTADDETTAIPAIGELYPGETDLYCRSVDIDSISDCGRVFLVSTPYSTPRVNMGSLEVEVDTETAWEIISQDVVNGAPIRNSAGMPFTEPQQREVERLVLSASRREVRNLSGSNSILWLMDNYNDRVNVAPYLGFPVGYWRMNIRARRVYEAGQWLWQVRYTIRGRPELWTLDILDEAILVKDEGGDKTVNTDSVGIVINQPQLLNGSGQLLTDGGDPYYGTWNQYRLADFNDLAIPFV